MSKADIKLKTLISQEAIKLRVSELGKEITNHYAHISEPLVLIGILKGSIVFFADLIREIKLPLQIEFLSASSYGNAFDSSGQVKVNHNFTQSIENKNLIIVEDIIDTGLTMEVLLNYFSEKKVASSAICALLQKPKKNIKGIKIDFLGFNIPNDFVVGYGLDYMELYRNLPYLGVLEGV
jgi:hypoxanthine phosphoribosyltransferase